MTAGQEDQLSSSESLGGIEDARYAGVKPSREETRLWSEVDALQGIVFTRVVMFLRLQQLCRRGLQIRTSDVRRPQGQAHGGFVCVINRNRDNYQVPLALAEAGLLKTFVTDYYAPDPPSRWLPRILRARRIDGLPAKHTRSTWSSFLIQAGMVALKMPTRRILNFSDRILSRRALAVAKRSNAALYCYASYVPRAHEIPAGMRMIDFEFHPLPQLTFELLREDADRYPEVAESFANERISLSEEVMVESWRRADAIVCASALTRRSLEYVGCPSERITVIPYGFRDRTALPAARPRVAGHCHFLFVGQGMQRKGLHHLIRAWQTADLPNCTLTLACYRIDPGIAALITSPSIRLLGRQSRAELDALYAASDVFVMPSLVEGFGLVYLEAIENGCHVIGTRATGLPDLPVSTDAVTLVEAGDLASIEAALRQLRNQKLSGALDPLAIQREVDKWGWSEFRKQVAAHARTFLAEEQA